MSSIELYEKIIDSLLKESVSLTNVLLLLRRLYEEIGDTCPRFVDKELKGYSADDEIPTYREIPSMRIFADSQFILGGIDQHRSIPVSLQGTHSSKTEDEYKICRGPVCEYQDLYAQGRTQTIVETLSDFEAEATSYTNVRVECRSADIARLLNAVRERINDAVHEIIARHPELCNQHQPIIAQSTTTYNTVNITGASNQVVAGGSDIAQKQNKVMLEGQC